MSLMTRRMRPAPSRARLLQAKQRALDTAAQVVPVARSAVPVAKTRPAARQSADDIVAWATPRVTAARAWAAPHVDGAAWRHRA